jgi:hypothetical protein
MRAAAGSSRRIFGSVESRKKSLCGKLRSPGGVVVVPPKVVSLVLTAFSSLVIEHSFPRLEVVDVELYDDLVTLSRCPQGLGIVQ